MPSDYAKFLMTLMCWREMRSVPRAWRMCLWTVLNRANARTPSGKPLWWGGDIVSVITKPYQYSSMGTKGDGQTVAWPIDGDPVWAEIAKEVDAVTSGILAIQTDATHYFSYPLVAPPTSWGPCHLVVGGDFGAAKFYVLDPHV